MSGLYNKQFPILRVRTLLRHVSFQAHVWDNETPVEETLRTFDDLIRCGKIRYFGYCNVCGWQMQKVVQETKRLGLNSCISLQVRSVQNILFVKYKTNCWCLIKHLKENLPCKKL